MSNITSYLQSDVFSAFIKIPISRQTPENCLTAVNADWHCFLYVDPKHQTHEMCEAAVRKNWQAFQFVREDIQDEQLAVLAAMQNGKVIPFVEQKNLTERVYCVAVVNDPSVIELVPLPMRSAILQKAQEKNEKSSTLLYDFKTCSQSPATGKKHNGGLRH